MTASEQAFAATRRALADGIDEGWFTRGAQASIRHRGRELLRWSGGDDGTGTPMTDRTLSRVYCSIKPITAIAIARQVEAGMLDLDEPLGGRLPGIASLADGRVKLRHVLTHTAGLHRPMGIEVELLTPAQRRRAVETRPVHPGFRVGVDAAYSEWLGWHLLGLLLDAVTGEPLREHLRSEVIEPLGLHDTWIGMTEPEYRNNLDRIGVNVDLQTSKPYPLLLERGARMCSEVNPAHGGYTTAADLARLHGLVMERLGGADHDALPSSGVLAAFTSSARPRVYDQVLGRDCEYGLGFMTDLPSHAFGRWPSARAFGHSGNVGTSFAFADPAVDLSVGVVFNGIVDHESAFLRRQALVRAIYTDLEDLEDDAAPVAAPEPVRARGFFRRPR